MVHDAALVFAVAMWVVVLAILASYAVTTTVRAVAATVEAVTIVRRRFRGVRIGLSRGHLLAALGKAVIDTAPFLMLGIAMGLPILANGKASEAYIGHGYLMLPGIVFGIIFGIGLVVSLMGLIARLATIALGLDPDPFPLPTIAGTAQERRHGSGGQQHHRPLARDYEAQVMIVGDRRAL